MSEAAIPQAKRRRRDGLADGLRRIIELVVLVAAGLVIALAVTVPLDLSEQFWFGACTITAMLVLGRSPSRQVTITLSILSLVVSSRYLYWRTTETLAFESPIGAFFGLGLYCAELYAWLVLVLGYLQTSWPLDRPIRPLNTEPTDWPTVDIYIPTYNEDLQIVADTALAASSLDYPKDRLRVYILDDGRREEFREFAEEAGVGYITRDNNLHAKAGNMNNALKVTDGEFISIFDCDHIPVRSFLQLGVGWFLEDPKLSLLQTPHHFYTPDPFQRNLVTGDRLQSEGDLFYQNVQMGNDFWNATFFCGSCAIIRRAALDTVGGFPGGSVTEDAHTAIKMQKLGWNTAYLNVRMAAGLATDSFSVHVGQRIRWARGMTQIFRMDNPIFAGGRMNWMQRLCYLNAMLHFQFPLPRFVFLTAPLAYLLFGQNIIHASAVTILAYAGPHLIHAWGTNSRSQGAYRRPMMGEVYESALCFHLIGPTIITMFDPNRGKFNVTQKGGAMDSEFFDWKIVRPHLICLAVLLFGIAFGFSKLLYPETFDVAISTLLLNVGWSLFNGLTILVAIAAARESRHPGTAIPLPAKLPVTLFFEDGHTLSAETETVSMAATTIRLPDGFDLDGRTVSDIEMPSGPHIGVFPVELLDVEGKTMRLKFKEMPLYQRRDLVRTVFGRADAWTPHFEDMKETPSSAILDLFRAGFGVFRPLNADLKKRKLPSAAQPVALGGASEPKLAAPTPAEEPAPGPIPASAAAMAAPERGTPVTGLRAERAPDEPAAQARPQKRRLFGMAKPRSISGAILALIVGLGLLTGGESAHAQSGSPTQQGSSAPFPGIAGSAGSSDDTAGAPMGRDPNAAPITGSAAPTSPPSSQGPSGNAQGQQTQPNVQSDDLPSFSVPSQAPSSSQTNTAPSFQSVPAGGAKQLSFTLKDLGVAQPLRLVGVNGQAGIPFSLSRDTVVTKARLKLSFGYSPSLLPELSHLSVLINGELVGSIPLVREHAAGVTVEFPINPAVFLPDNTINLRFSGHYTYECEDPLHSSLWTIISNTESVLQLSTQQLPTPNDLKTLPRPFFDTGQMGKLNLPFVFPTNPTNATLQAAGAVASYFGMKASFRGFSFPVRFGDLPTDNAVVFVTAAERIPGLSLPPINGPTLAVASNPRAPLNKLLLVMGRNAEEVTAAAYTLAVGASSLSGAVSTVSAPSFTERKPYDAPRWINTDKPVPLGDLVEPSQLQGYGLPPGAMTVSFRAAPDLFVWREKGYPATVRYRYPDGEWLDRDLSRLDVSLNDIYLDSFPLTGSLPVEDFREFVGEDYILNQGVVEIPPYQVFGLNRLQFFFDLKVHKAGECESYLPEGVRSGIDPDSTIDFTNAEHFTRLPNLSYFASAGFPFTRYADLSETVALLAPRPSNFEVSTFLEIMGRMGDSTGLPVTGLTILRGGDLANTAGKDVLVIGTLDFAAQLGDLFANAPFEIENDRLRVKIDSPLERVFTMVGSNDELGPQEADRVLVSQNEFAGLGTFLSPYGEKRVVVAALAGKPEDLPKLIDGLEDPEINASIQGDLAVAREDKKMSSFRVGPTFWAGSLPMLVHILWYFSNKPILMVVLLLFAVALISTPIYLALRAVARNRVKRNKG